MAAIEEDPPTASPSHPEEIKSTFDLRVGNHITLQGSARITPAGVICTGIAVTAMTFALGYLISSARHRAG
ncbi:hypothetical protein LJR030_000368 [Rhizobium sp. LjRoot30]|uniref:hypothetical protein n=1 Tax=Rhizobium sp. LjRoot30 TaxID=3342320 RepID=UPI003ED07A9E